VITIRKIALFAIPFTLYATFLLAPAAATLQELQVGMEVPEFSLRTISGETSKLAELRGEKLTILFFWSTWSKNSAKGLARMEKLHHQFGDRGLSIIGINADGQNLNVNTIEAVKEMTGTLKITFPMLLDQGLSAFRDIGVIALPTTVILDRERIIRYELSGYPLVGVEELADYVTAAIEGNKPAMLAGKKGYQPDKNALRLFNMGRNTLKTRRMAEAAEGWFKKAIAADPRFVQPHLSLGKLYLQRGDIPAAKAQFEQSLAKEPDNVVALCEMGMIIAGEGKTEQGMTFFEKTLQADDAYTPCYYYRGYLLGRTGKHAEALKLFDAAMEINPNDQGVRIYKARMYEENGMPQQAAEEYRKALAAALRLE
jgi:Tfp pilus assembly protein PilF/peroxiredoxin